MVGVGRGAVDVGVCGEDAPWTPRGCQAQHIAGSRGVCTGESCNGGVLVCSVTGSDYCGGDARLLGEGTVVLNMHAHTPRRARPSSLSRCLYPPASVLTASKSRASIRAPTRGPRSEKRRLRRHGHIRPHACRCAQLAVGHASRIRPARLSFPRLASALLAPREPGLARITPSRPSSHRNLRHHFGCRPLTCHSFWTPSDTLGHCLTQRARRSVPACVVVAAAFQWPLCNRPARASK
jgi:hypothetical protein